MLVPVGRGLVKKSVPVSSFPFVFQIHRTAVVLATLFSGLSPVGQWALGYDFVFYPKKSNPPNEAQQCTQNITASILTLGRPQSYSRSLH